MNQVLHLKYRPASFAEVIGHKSEILSLKKVLKQGRSRAFLFVGLSGCGKTTLARIVAKEVGCSEDNIIEVDGATTTSIDAVRELADRLQYATIDGSPRCVIYDEFHSCSRQALQSLLKILEEPPAGVYWCLCTTEGDKIPKQIKTRCSTYNLRPVADDVILVLLQKIRTAENMEISDEGLDLIVEVAMGSPRQAIVFLATCGDFKKIESIKAVLTETDIEDAEIVELCRLLLQGGGDPLARWAKITAKIKVLTAPPETIRVSVLRYMAAVALGRGQVVMPALEVMTNFGTPYVDREGLAPLVLSCARSVFGE